MIEHKNGYAAHDHKKTKSQNERTVSEMKSETTNGPDPIEVELLKFIELCQEFQGKTFRPEIKKESNGRW